MRYALSISPGAQTKISARITVSKNGHARPPLTHKNVCRVLRPLGQNECAAAHTELIPKVNPLSFAGSERPNSGLRFNAVERLGGRRPSFLSAAVHVPTAVACHVQTKFQKAAPDSILWTHFRVGSTLPSTIAQLRRLAPSRPINMPLSQSAAVIIPPRPVATAARVRATPSIGINNCAEFSLSVPPMRLRSCRRQWLGPNLAGGDLADHDGGTDHIGGALLALGSWGIVPPSVPAKHLLIKNDALNQH